MISPGPAAAGSNSTLHEDIAWVAHLLPAQGPINIFIHHNTLHAFEPQPFEDAVVAAGELFGCQPFLSEERYRAELASGRITDPDLRAAVAWDLGHRRADALPGPVSRLELAFAVARFGIPPLKGPTLRWHLEELDALERLRPDAPSAARDAAAAARGLEGDDESEARLVQELWAACLGAMGRAPPQIAASPAASPRRRRDALLAATGVDLDAITHPPFIRFLAAYLDQGFALWGMAGREGGLYASFRACYDRPLGPLLGAWAGALRTLLAADAGAGRDGLASIDASLDALEVAPGDRRAYLLATALSLRGWAGMVRQIEERPDRVPVAPVPARLADLLAVQLLLERAALEAELGAGAPLPEVSPAPLPAPTLEERAWPLFQLAQLLGWYPQRIAALSGDEAAELEAALLDFGGVARRRCLHLAYERHLRRRLLDALAYHRPHASPERPWAQAIFCLDEREESLRRHLEEVAPGVETLGAAGFFGVAIYFRGEGDARARPLAPIAIQPQHYLEAEGAAGRALPDQLSQLRSEALHLGSRGLFRGALVSTLGALTLVPLIARTLAPRLGGAPRLDDVTEGGRRLAVRRAGGRPPSGQHFGFTALEMADIVARLLADMGLAAQDLAPLVLVAGHRAASVNNPHRSAYDCGACGGGPGGANAQAFAAMANDPEVRGILAGRGVAIPEGTWFVGAEHNTTDDRLLCFDVDRIPAARRGDFARLEAAVGQASARNAQERCRRFARLGPLSPEAALAHVRARRMDLAEPRPEYNHATNAFCILGRRSRTRGLFLDRRAFLCSYDPTRDDAEGTILRRLLAAVVPVVAGINLEYLFGAVDNEGYGAGTKLPHNVSALLGVMNGAEGDLRPGLWAQTVELHEPVRLTLVVEAPAERVQGAFDAHPGLRRLLEGRWLMVAALDPDSGALTGLTARGPRPYVPERAPARARGPSINWTRGKGGHLPFAVIEGPEAEGAP